MQEKVRVEFFKPTKWGELGRRSNMSQMVRVKAWPRLRRYGFKNFVHYRVFDNVWQVTERLVRDNARSPL
jgi:hypothetical protein